jgi:hypothetical protein
VLIERNLVITSVVRDSLDVNPRGYGCYDAHEFLPKIEANDFIYRICPRCGTVRINERTQSSGGTVEP